MGFISLFDKTIEAIVRPTADNIEARRHQAGRDAFIPGVDPWRVFKKPYYSELWNGSYAEDWVKGWYEAEKEYEEKKKENKKHETTHFRAIKAG